MKIHTKARCPECSRVFDLLDDNDCQEWSYGHDCEVEQVLTIHAGDCSTDCPTCVANCDCSKCKGGE